MEKQIAAVFGGKESQVGELKVNRLLPNRYIHAVGPFVFLDHLYPYLQKAKKTRVKDGKFAHPHRGIATFSYIFSGELEHYDSMGNYGIVRAGGAQWMKAGNGIIHDEEMSSDFQEKGGVLHGLQFWINLPEKNKAEDPAYLALQNEDVPEVDLANTGVIRVLIGEYQGKRSAIETYTEQFVYHLKLSPNAEYSLDTTAELEYAVFLPEEGTLINGKSFGKSEILAFEEGGDRITFANASDSVRDIILFGGEPYTEPIVAEGPFVMNTRGEIADAYSAFFNGNYGVIEYNRQEGV